MANPSRFPNYGSNRYPGSGLPSTRIHPIPNHLAYGGYPTPSHAHNPAPIDPTTGHHPSAYTHEEPYIHNTPGPNSAPWVNLPRQYRFDLDPEWPYPTTRPPHPSYWPHWPGSIDPEAARRTYLPIDYGQRMDAQHRRLKWRDELLTGEPEKAIAEHLAEASRVVVSLVTRGPPDHSHGQGDELLGFQAIRKPQLPPSQDMRYWAHFALDATPIIPPSKEDVIPSAAELSKKSLIALIPALDPEKDLKLVRQSRPLLWDSTTVLETFLYRIVEEKEDPSTEAGANLLERLSNSVHIMWTPISDPRAFKQFIEGDIISTAIDSVYLHPTLSGLMDNILADIDSRPDELCQRALDLLYVCVSGRCARMAFDYYPIPPPPDGQKEHELCIKRRTWAYWTEVVTWHLCRVREDAQVSTSYALLKCLSAVKASVDDSQVNLEQLENIMIHAIIAEADRSKNATSIVIREGIGECLHNPAFAPPEDKLEKMHIITAGSSSTVYQVITKLITHVLTRKTSPTETSSKSILNRQVLDLKITIAESRPLNEGVVLASRLARVIETFTEYRDRASKHAKRDSEAPSAVNLGLSSFDPELHTRLRQTMAETEQLRSPLRLQSNSLGLAHLLAEFEAKKKEKKEPKVTIELVTDAAVVSATIASGNSGVKPIILLSADRILPNGDAVNKVGSAQLAWAGKSSGGIVLILCRADRIHSPGLPSPAKLSCPPDQLETGWKSTFEAEFLNDFLKSAHVTISNPAYENINYEHITGYITELGFMEKDILAEFSKMRSDLEKLVWPPNALTG